MIRTQHALARAVASAACAVLLAGAAPWTVHPVAASPVAPVPSRGAPPASSELVPLPKLSYTISKAKIEYFPIEGSTYKELMASLADAAAGPCEDVETIPTQGDRIVAGCMTPSLRAKTLTTRTCTGASCVSACKVTAVTGTSVVHLPRWTSPSMVPTLLLGWWRTVSADIRRHEARHVTIFNQWLVKLRKAAVGKSCASWPSISKSYLVKMSAAQAAFDRAELEVAWPRPPVEDY